jgi:exosortase
MRLPDLRQPWRPVAASLLAAFAFRALATFEPSRAIPDPIERLLFEPADTSPAVVVVLGLWLLWRRRERWLALPGGSAAGALCLPWLAAGAGLLAWSRLTGATDLLVLALLATGFGLAALAKGAAGMRVVALPALFLLFALPIPPALSNALIYQLQLWTAELSGRLLFLFGSPAHVAGETILRANYTFSVVEGCSGLRSVVTLSMLAVLMVDLFRRRTAHALIVVLAAPFVAFLLNTVRAVALIVNPHSAIASVHVAQGIAILLCGLLVLYALDGLLERLLPRVAAARPGAAAAAPARAARWPAALAYLGLLALGSVAIRPWTPRDIFPLGLENRYAKGLGEWRGSPLTVDPLFLGSVTFRESFSARYRRGADTLELFLGVGDLSQRFVSPLSAKTELPGSGWVVEERWKLALEPEGSDADALLIRSGARWRLVQHWTVASRGPFEEALRSLLALDATPWRRQRDPLVIRLVTDLSGPGADQRARAETRLQSFHEPLRVELQRMLRDMDWMSTEHQRKGFS